MGVKSTIDIDKKEAMYRINGMLPNASNETISRVLEILNDEIYDKGDYEYSLGLHNFHIT